MALMALKAHTFFRANRQWETLKAHKALKSHTSPRRGTVPRQVNNLYQGPVAVRTPSCLAGHQFFTPH
jgi:hypothetical protein